LAAAFDLAIGFGQALDLGLEAGVLGDPDHYCGSI
jgi:hypothetical protein